MIIWSGHGYVLPVMVAILVSIGLMGGTKLGLSDTHALALGFLLAALACWKVGWRMNAPAKGRAMIEVASGETIVLRQRHTVFWIEVQWWAIPCIIAAIGNGLRDNLYPDGGNFRLTTLVLMGIGLAAMVLGPRLLARKGSP